MEYRKPTSDESRLLKELATIAGMQDPEAWLETLQVMNMDDGGMGSLELVAPGLSHGSSRKLLVCKAAVQFVDADGVEVIASLNAREDGVPFELDLWKTVFSRLITIPNSFRRVEE